MEAKTPNMVTARRNPPRKARPTPSSAVPTSLKSSSNISSFPIEDILSMEKQASSENLKVFLRVRPFFISQRKAAKSEKTVRKIRNAWPKSTNAVPKKLKNSSNESCVMVNDAHSVTVSPPLSLQDSKRPKSEVYQGFSQVFSSDASQMEVYEKMVNPLVEDFLKGRSGMLAALGPSGSGKTHTIFGCGRDPGMLPLALRRILSQGQGDKMLSQRTFYLSMFEICSEKGKSEKIFDLSQGGTDLCIQQSSSIKGMQEVVLCDAQQAESLIACGLLKRATAMTNSNSQSSRSQCIINIRCEYKLDGQLGDNSNGAVLTIVDLAGSEREKKTGNQGVRLIESNFINNTSMVFGLCLRSLLEHQKNRRRPMQKHFQNSLLTRYLRDYLEGKKRMALLLTVRPGEEDYLDTSLLLRQTSPYAKIKFDIIEEQGNFNHNKRPVQTVPTVGQLKRMKLSRSETCEVNKGREECIQLQNEEAAVEGVKDGSLTDVQSEEIITIKESERNILRVDHVELETKDRNYQILQNFGKALWKVLKEYRKKLEVAENEICTLRECLTNEKTRSDELENELRDWRSNCCCPKGVSSELSSSEVDKFIREGFLDFEEHQSTHYNEAKPEVYSSHSEGSEHTRKEEWLDSTTTRPLENTTKDANGVENWKDSNDVKSESTHLDHKTTAILSGSPSCIDQEYGQEEENSDKNDMLEKDHHAHSDLVLPACTINFSESYLFFENLVGEDHIQSEEDKVKSEVNSCHSERSEPTRNEERLDSTGAQLLENCIENATDVGDSKVSEDLKSESTHLDDKETAMLSWLPSCISQEYEREKENSVSTSQETLQIRDKNDVLEEDHKLFDSVPPECTVISSESTLCVENPVVGDQTQSKAYKKPMGPYTMLMPEEVVHAVGRCNTEAVIKHDFCTKFQNAVKPKRRLIPVSSALLKDIGSIDFRDENERPKGVKAEKKGAAGGNRTQGSLSLLSLLKDNLAI